MITPYYDHAGITIYHADARVIMPHLPPAKLLLTDPPFNVGKDYGESKDNLPTEEYADLMKMVAEFQADHQAWITPTNRIALFASLLPNAKPVVIPRGAQGPKRWGWYDQFDMILIDGIPNRWVHNLWTGIRLKGEGYYFREEWYDHPGYTPYPIMARCVNLMSEEGDLIVDPFCGTGTSLRAAKDQGRRAIGIDSSEHWCEVAATRMAQEVMLT